MATYLENVTDQIIPTPTFSPDFNFYNSILQRKSMQYEEGFAKVNSAYNQVLNAQLSDSSNRDVRDQYIKDSEEKLKNLSNTDLSKNENIQAASGVFENFYKDDLLLKDMAYTKHYNNEIQKAFALRDSSDPKERERFSMTAVQYVANAQEKLTNAGRDAKAYQNLERRSYVPFINEKEYYTEQAKAMGLDVSFDDVAGGYIVSRKGMPKKTLEEFAMSVGNDGLRNQYQVMGIVAKEGQIKSIQRQFPGMNEQDAQSLLVENNIKNIKKGVQTQVDNYNSEISAADTEISKYKALGENLTVEQGQRYRQLLMEKLSMEKGRDNFQNQYSNDFESKFKNDPDSYFALDAQRNSISNWASAYSLQNQGVTIKNTAPHDMAMAEAGKSIAERTLAETINKNAADNKLGYAKLDSAERIAFAKGNGKPGSNGSGNGSLGDGQFVGSASTDNENRGTALDALVDQQMYNLAIETNIATDTENGTAYFLKDLPLTDEEIVIYASDLKRQIVDPDYKAPEKNHAANIKVRELLSKATGVKITGPGTAQIALDKLASQGFKNRTQHGGVGLSDLPPGIMGNLSLRNQANQEYHALENQKIKAQDDYIASSTDPEFQKLIKTNSDGKKVLVQASDLAKNFSEKNYTFVNDDGERINYTREQLAGLYMSGKISYNQASEPNNHGLAGGLSTNRLSSITIDGQNVTQAGKNNLVSDIQSKLRPRYGDSKDINSILSKAKNNISPNLPDFDKKTGRMSSKIIYDPAQGDGAFGLAHDLSNPANIGTVFLNGDPTKTTDTTPYINLFKLGEEHIKNVVSSVGYIPSNERGKQALEITMAPINDSNKQTYEGVGLKDVLNKKITIELSDNASGDFVSQLPKGKEYYVYDGLRNGTPLKSPQEFEKAGVRYRVQPNDASNPTAITTTIETLEYNANGDPSWVKHAGGRYELNKQDVDKVVPALDNILIQLISDRTEKQKQKQAKDGVKASDIEKEFYSSLKK